MSTSYGFDDGNNYDDKELMLMQMNMLQLQTMTLLLVLDDSEIKISKLIAELNELQGQVAVCEHDGYFVQKNDAVGLPGLTPHLKASIYGSKIDSYVESFVLEKSTSYESLKRFCATIIDVFSRQYLREPIPANIERITVENATRGFLCMLQNIDCTHWCWSSFPVEEHGALLGHKGQTIVILEAVATRNTWIWKSFFGTPGSNNDLNILECSLIFEDILRGKMPTHHFVVNRHEYNMGYYLADDLYLEYVMFVKSKENPTNLKEKIYAQYQEGARKDIERAFDILQKRFAVLVNPTKLWSLKDLTMIVEVCIITHNMIVEDERHTNLSMQYKEPVMPPGCGLDRDP